MAKHRKVAKHRRAKVAKHRTHSLVATLAAMFWLGLGCVALASAALASADYSHTYHRGNRTVDVSKTTSADGTIVYSRSGVNSVTNRSFGYTATYYPNYQVNGSELNVTFGGPRGTLGVESSTPYASGTSGSFDVNFTGPAGHEVTLLQLGTPS